MLSTKTVASGGLERRSLAEMQWMEGFADCWTVLGTYLTHALGLCLG